MFQVDPLSRQPVYEQIIDSVERYVLTGVLKPGDQIPSVRSLSTQLSINPNTIQKAYTELDRRGIIHSAPGRGCFICTDAATVIRQNMAGKLNTLRELTGQLKLAHFEKEELIKIIEEVYSND
jgi:GntR family transcriptional regulator